MEEGSKAGEGYRLQRSVLTAQVLFSLLGSTI